MSTFCFLFLHIKIQASWSVEFELFSSQIVNMCMLEAQQIFDQWINIKLRHAVWWEVSMFFEVVGQRLFIKSDSLFSPNCLYFKVYLCFNLKSRTTEKKRNHILTGKWTSQELV